MGLKRLFFLLIFLIFTIGSYATHIVGGELNYQPVNDSLYNISLKVYRDCYLGVPQFDNPALVRLFDGNGTFIRTISVQRPPWVRLDADLENPCLAAPPNVCVESIDYKFQLNLPPNSSGYYLSYQRCCRNATILNMWDAKTRIVDSTGATYWAFIPPVQQSGYNANPVFKKFPPVVICVNTPFIFDHSATDTDGDVLRYELCTPFNGGTAFDVFGNNIDTPPFDTLVYQPGYSLQNMLGSQQPLKIDSITGLMTCLPTRIGQFVVGVRVKEYRNGKLIAQTNRDFQFNVAECIDKVRANFTYEDTLCNDKTLTLTNTTTVATEFLWNFGDGDTSSQKNPVHIYKNPGTYNITLIANPGRSCSDTISKKVWVIEENAVLNAPDQLVCAGISQQISVQIAGVSIKSIDWKVNNKALPEKGTSFNYTFWDKDTVTYILKTNSNCVFYDTFIVDVRPPLNIDAIALPSSFLPGDSVLLSVQLPIGNFPVVWSPSGIIQNPDKASSFAYPFQDQWFYVKVTDPQTGCVTFDSVLVIKINCNDTLRTNFSATFDKTCIQQQNQLTAISTQVADRYIWFINGDTISGVTASVLYNQPGSYPVTLIAQVDDFCSDTIQKNIEVIAPYFSYAKEDYVNCRSANLLIDLNITSQGDYWVNWSFRDPAQPIKNTDTINYILNLNEKLYFTIEDSNACRIQDSIQLSISDPGNVEALSNKTLVLPGEVFTLSATPPTGFNYTWKPDTLLQQPFSSQSNASIQSPQLFIVTVADSLGCERSDSIFIDINYKEVCNGKYIFIPNAFTPDNNGKNDVWKVRSVLELSIQLVVFDRWGTKVFETNNIQQGWDGTYQNEKASAGAYGYKIKVLCPEGFIFESQGELILIR